MPYIKVAMNGNSDRSFNLYCDVHPNEMDNRKRKE